MPNLSRLIFFYLVALQVTLASECCINITVVINTTVFSDEIGWETIPKSDAFSNQIYSDFSLYKHEHCLPPNTEFTFLAKDSFGDGWEGGSHFHIPFFILSRFLGVWISMKFFFE